MIRSFWAETSSQTGPTADIIAAMTYLLGFLIFNAGLFVGIFACGLGRAAKVGDMMTEEAFRSRT